MDDIHKHKKKEFFNVFSKLKKLKTKTSHT